MNENIVSLNYGEKEILLVKTAHVSKNSVDDVVRCFEEFDPDCVCIELDEQRYASITDKDRWRNSDLVESRSPISWSIRSWPPSRGG